MKKKIFILMALTMLLCLPPTASAVERNFPAGSLLIPMDIFYQSAFDGGILEAYGLVFALLNHKNGTGEPDITVYWLINEEKTSIDGPDLVIEDLTVAVDNPVVKLYNHANGTSNLTFQAGDDYQRITYSGGVFLVDGADAEAAKTIVNQVNWAAVEVHEAQVPFKARVSREMTGTPPRIALMNDTEDKTGGNASIMEAYLRLAGICTNVYDVVTPNEIRDGILLSGNGVHDGIDNDADGEVDELGEEAAYDLLWAAHWAGYDGYDSDNNGSGLSDVEDIVIKVKEFLEQGKGLLAEGATIEVFEHSQNGRFLSTKGIGHNGGTNDPATIVYNDITAPNAQIADFPFMPVTGQLQSWRPFVEGDPYTGVGTPPDQTSPPEVSAGNPSVYHDTVKRFTADNTGWDYYVGGYAYGDRNNGYVAYLSGHKYAICSTSAALDPEPNALSIHFEFDQNLTTELFDLTVGYDSGSTTTVIGFGMGNFTAQGGYPLQVDVTTAWIKDKKLFGITLKNIGTATVTVDHITLSWIGGTIAYLKKIINHKNDVNLYDNTGGVPSGTQINVSFLTIPPGDTNPYLCADNSDCVWTNTAGVRYVLNTLFNIQSHLQSQEYARAAPIVAHDYLYQGTFEYPSWEGHFRRYRVTDASASVDDSSVEWDTAQGNHIAAANTGNADGRKIYTSKKDLNGDWIRIDFDAANIGALREPLDLTPLNFDDSDEIEVITRVRGKERDANGQWVERANKLGGIMHSAPAIVTQNSRTGSRDEVAYVGDLYGMLHAIETSTGNEKWAFIPSNLLGKLKNDRSDPNAVQDFAAVDGSPAVVDIYYDHDNNVNTPKQWRTILVCTEGWGGNYLFALDVTDPDNWSVIWELTVEAILSYIGTGNFTTGSMVTGQTSGATGLVVADDTESDALILEEAVGQFQNGETVFVDANGNGVPDAGEVQVTVTQVVEMGHAYRAAVNAVKWPVRDNQGDVTGYEQKWVIYVATGYLDIAEDHGGINVFAFDLLAGDRLWHFSDPYLSSVNDIPSVVIPVDTTGDNLVDRVYVGDMDGRLWELDAVVGTNLNGTAVVDGVTKQMPLWNAGVGKPIAISPVVVHDSGHVVLVFGTGGTDWAANDQAYSIYAVDATEKQTDPTYWNPASERGGAGTLLWEFTLAVGEKVWSAPKIAAGQIFVATGSGTTESADLRQDVSGTGKLYSLNLADGTQAWTVDNIGKARGSIYVDRQHVYLTTINNQIRQIGEDNFPEGEANNVVLKAWREFW